MAELPERGAVCGFFDVPGCIYAAVTPFGSELKIEKVLLRKIRLKVLDCRSGEPLQDIPVEQVLIAPPGETLDPKKHQAVRFFGQPGWDITEHYIFPVAESGKNAGLPLNWTGFSQDNRSNLQKALSALGYDCGKISPKFEKQDWKVLEKFQSDWSEAYGQPKPAKFKQEVTAEWTKRILAEYNRGFLQAVQLYLTALGYPCEKDKGEWKEASQEALARWQKVELGTKDPFTSFNSLKQLGARRKLAETLKEARKRFFTDAAGVLHIPVPIEKMRTGFQLKVSFADFAVALEEAGLRGSYDVRPTGFGIEYENPQGSGGGFGWRLRPPRNNASRASLPEFRTALELQIPPADKDTLTWHLLADATLSKAKFSPFFKKIDAHPEIVIFALVWCQPVWDDISDPTPGHNINDRAYVEPDSGVRGRSMHIVTKACDLGGSDDYGGKGYGKVEKVPVGSTRWRGDDGHAGFDLHARVGDKVFAVHAGKILRHSGGDGGNTCTVQWKGAGRTSIGYLHLSAFVAATGAWVRAGEVVGLAGRSGNLGQNTDNPGHTHLNVGANGYTCALYNTPDPANRVCIPTNDTALLFPCVCDVPNAAVSPANCRFGDNRFVSTCWAVAELRCPYMWGAGRSVRRLQAQLRRRYELLGAPYVDPGKLDGSLGALPGPNTPANSIGRTRRALRGFRIANGLLAATAKPQEGCEELSTAEWDLLDQLAQVEEPEVLPARPLPAERAPRPDEGVPV